MHCQLLLNRCIMHNMQIKLCLSVKCMYSLTRKDDGICWTRTYPLLVYPVCRGDHGNHTIYHQPMYVKHAYTKYCTLVVRNAMYVHSSSRSICPQAIDGQICSWACVCMHACVYVRSWDRVAGPYLNERDGFFMKSNPSKCVALGSSFCLVSTFKRMYPLSTVT